MTISNRNRLRRTTLVSALALALASPGLVAAQDAGAEDDEDTTDGTTQLDAVQVVGSRIKRSEIEGPAPVTVITREDFDREGFKTVADALQTLTQNTTSSFTGDLAVTGFTPNAQVVNLRNLGPGYTLTLINGRRPAQYPQPYNRDNNVVNVRAIPSSIIERVEILSGGASAIYGSDAVAGVVNIVLRENFDSNLIRGTVGVTEGGGGESYGFEYTGGRSGDRWSTTFALQYGHNEPVFASQRDQFDSLIGGPRVATGYEANIFPALSLVAIRASAHPSGPTGHESMYGGQVVCDRFGYTTVTTPGRGTYCGSFDTVASRSISNENKFYSGYGYARFDITDTLSFFASGTFYEQDAIASSGTEFWGTAGDRFNQNSAGNATSVYFDPQVGHLVQLQRIFQPFELGGNEAASTVFDESTFDITAGLMGTLGDRFDWEASIQHSEYKYTADRPRLLAQAVHNYFLGERLGFISGFPINELNLERWYTPITPEIYRSFATRVINEGNTESTNLNFVLSGDLFELPAGPVGFAAIGEWGRQATLLESDPRTSQTRPLDNQTIYNLTSSGRTEGERDRYALGAEFRLPITSNFSAQLAARYDKYDDITAVDDSITYNLGLEFRPLDSLLLRASYATSFRAPDMQLVFAEGAASFSTILDYYSCRSGTGPGSVGGPRQPADCNVANDPTVYQAQTLIAGNPLLKEEEGESLTAGFVWDIIDNMSLTVDYYRIKLTDAAGQLSATYVLTNEANCRLGMDVNGNVFDPNSAFCQNIMSLVTRQVAPGTTLDGRVDRINSAYINRAAIDTSGIDARFRYMFETARWGTFRTDLSYSLVLTDKFQEFEDTPMNDFRDSLDPFASPQRSRVRGSLSWDYNDWSTTVFGVRYGSVGSADSSAAAASRNYCASNLNPPEPERCWGRRLAPYMIYNLSVGKRISDSVYAQFQVLNVLDNQYREDNAQVGYPFFNNFIGADPLGRRYNVTVQYRF